MEIESILALKRLFYSFYSTDSKWKLRFFILDGKDEIDGK